MRTQARALGFRHIDFGMFPMVKYTGYADLFPENCVSRVLSEAMITGAMVPPKGMASSIEFQQMEIHRERLI